ncbi:MAG: mechanosensitive ion channel family protein [Marinobacter sp.]|uniref:mechanosensitive ion channel family protein n=1 Tax=Marinobacter sp. TaxID=50741 RepID=UPI0029C3434E|nr:mechanosensitive ion channel domain-containing protein [Marinobacter sp.]MDX5336259.1 mechanosensitive ion channel family protein [Marinobacter sp.]MDX5387323.1 mechanosensitive ion channel family protein [Marinobacter sp.]MDX5439432.1 mechanosensitive ion channel family protein [Alteromonadaceae bacterium]MDX5472685.1 mechanosensitive ion channel family protein [Marinobacter sp.]
MGDIGFKETFASITTDALLNALMVVILASLVIMLVQKLLPALAGKLGGKLRLYLLASVPLLRLLIIVLAIVTVVPILVEPSFENMVAIFGALGLALGFAFKDYANSLIAGIVTLYEMPYRPGDWIEVNGRYGEVRSIGTRAAEIVTLDDTVIVIPHSLLWNTLLANGNDGTDNLMCVAELHLDPNHNVARMQQLFRDVVFTCPLTKTYQPVIVTVSATDDAMRYRLKAYPLEPREQSRFISDLTARAADVCAREGVRMVSKRVTDAD